MRVIRIGRDDSNDYVIDHPAVSSYHADLYVYDNGAMQLFEHSTNGTYANDRFIHNNTCLLFGNEVLVFPDQKPVHISKILNVDVKADTDKPEDELPDRIIGETEGHYGKPGMDFGETLSYYFSHYATFNGRARRQEYWYIALWNLIFGIIPGIDVIWVLVTIIPSFALSVRRLHDVGKSGWWLLISLIPVIGAIVLFVWSVTDSEPHENQYGPSPKYS